MRENVKSDSLASRQATSSHGIQKLMVTDALLCFRLPCICSVFFFFSSTLILAHRGHEQACGPQWCSPLRVQNRI